MLVSPLWPVSAQTVPVRRASAPAQQGSMVPDSAPGVPTGARGSGTLPTSELVSAPNITATKTDSPAGPVSPGDTITYTVVISNTGTGDATGVQFNDAVDVNTTFVNGSLTSTPLAAPDTYNVIGNVRIQVPHGSGDLLSNDCDPSPSGCVGTGLTITTFAGDSSAPFSGTSTQGGQVTAATGDGSFSYNPPAGYAGTDTFNYTLTDSEGKTDTATVTLNVGNGTATPGSNVVWFVNPAAPSGGDGRLTSPFNCYTGVSASCFSQTAADDPGDTIFLNSGSHTGGNTLLNNQKLVGAGATDTLANIAGLTVPSFSDALPTTGGASPTITTSAAATNAVPLGQNNTLRGFTVGNTTGAKISGSNFGVLTVGKAGSPDVTLSGTGQALNLSTGTLSVVGGFASVTTISSGAQGINLTAVADSDGAGGSAFFFGSTTVSGSLTQGIFVQQSTADLNFGNTSIMGGTDGVSLSNNSAGTRTFGTLSVSNNSGVGFLHSTGGGTTVVTGATAITNPGGGGIQVQGSTTAVNFADANVTQSGATGVVYTGSGGNLTFADLDISPDSGVQALSATTSGGTISSTSGTVSTVNATALAAVSTALNLTFDGVSANVSAATAAPGVTLTNESGTLTVNGGTITGGAATAFAVTGGSINSTYKGNITQSNAQRLINVDGTTGGAITFNTGALTAASGSTGVNINNANGNVSFATLTLGTNAARLGAQAVTITGGSGVKSLGAVSIFTSGVSGIAATNSTGAITTASGTVDSTGAAAVTISGASAASPTPLNVQLTAVSANGGVNGIALSNTSATGSPGGFNVLGDGTTNKNSTGGALQNQTGDAISLTNVTSPSFSHVNILNTAHNGVKGRGVVNFTFNYGTIDNSGTGGAAGDSNIYFGESTYGTSVGGEKNLTGVVSILGNTLNNAFYHGIHILNYDGTISDLNVSGNSMTSSTSAAASNGTGVHVVDFGTSTTVSNITKGHVDNNSFKNFPSQGAISLQVGNATAGGSSTGNWGTPGSATNVITIDNNFATTSAGVKMGTSAILVANAGTGVANVSVSNNGSAAQPIGDTVGTTIGISVKGNATLEAKVNNNYVVSNNGLGSNGIAVGGAAQFGVSDVPTLIVTANNNNISNTSGVGLYALMGGCNGNMKVTIQGNTVGASIGAGNRPAIRVDAGSGATDDTNVCATIGGATAALKNTATGVGTFASFGTGVRKQGTVATVNYFSISGLPGPAPVSASSVGTYLASQNNGGALVISGDNFENSCPLPLLLNENSIGASLSQVLRGIYPPLNVGTAVCPPESVTTPVSALPCEFYAESAGQYALVPLSQAELDTAVASALGRWASAGLTRGQLSLLRGVRFEVVDLPDSYLGEASGNRILVDRNAGGKGWFVDSSLTSDSTFARIVSATRRYTSPSGAPVGRVDLLTAVEHEMGHRLGLPDTYDPQDRDSVMYGYLTAGERRLPSAGQAAASGRAPADGARYLTLAQDGAIKVSRAAQSLTPQTPQTSAPLTRGAATGGTTDTTTAVRRSPPAPAAPACVNDAGHVCVQIGTLRAGDSVTITFQVKVNDLYSGGPNASNQGIVSYNESVSPVLTDDPDTATPNDPTLTPINLTNIQVNDAKQPEPTSGTSQMLFTVTLSSPAGPSGVSVNYSTANGGATPATGGTSCDGTSDYITASGTLSIPSGSKTGTIPVTICSDSNSEGDETLLMNISSPSTGNITDAQATGTITANTPGTFIISEFRTRGSAGASDDFVELYNNTNSSLTVAASDASAGYGVYKMGATCNDTPVLVGTIPNGTVIPARGHYLMVGSAYSLANYGGTGAAAGNLTMTSDLEDDRNIAVFSTGNIDNISSANRLDAVGTTGNTGNVCDLMHEGTSLAPVGAQNVEYSYFRKECDFAGGCQAAGNSKDSNDNAADFMFADTQMTSIAGITRRLGAPGPENLASPIRRDDTGALVPLLDGTKSSSAVPNRDRDFVPVTNGPNGTLYVRRRIQNTTGATITRLRFRIIEMTTGPTPPVGTTDLRLITSTPVVISGITDPATCASTGTPTTAPCQVTAQATTLETPPTQPNGGGYNSTVSVSIPGGLANNASIDVNFALGVVQGGTFRFYIIVEALP